MLDLPFFGDGDAELASRAETFARDVVAPLAHRVDREDPIAGGRQFVALAARADLLRVFVADNRSAFVVDANARGFRVVRQIETLAPHPLGELQLDGCRVPASHRLGEEGEGLKIALRTLDFFRASVGAAACGMAACALSEATAYA